MFKKVLKPIVTLGNIGFVVYMIGFVVDEGFDGPLLQISFLILLCLNIYFINCSNREDGWFKLILRRKALEEKKKIEKLKSEK